MRRIPFLAAAGLCLVLGGLNARADDKPPPSTCGNHGTTVAFLGSPQEAATRAAREQKLVFVLHVSGHFEDPTFT